MHVFGRSGLVDQVLLSPETTGATPPRCCLRLLQLPRVRGTWGARDRATEGETGALFLCFCTAHPFCALRWLSAFFVDQFSVFQ